jgi:hypothetical protein
MKTLFALIGRVFAAIVNRIRTLFGYPPPPEPEQIGERLITAKLPAAGTARCQPLPTLAA